MAPSRSGCGTFMAASTWLDVAQTDVQAEPVETAATPASDSITWSASQPGIERLTTWGRASVMSRDIRD